MSAIEKRATHTGNAAARGALGIGAIAGCGTATGDPPNYIPLTTSQKQFLREAFSGRGATLFSNQCFSANITNDLIRGFATIDVVETCGFSCSSQITRSELPIWV